MSKEKMKTIAKRLFCYEYSGRYCKICGFDSFENPWLMEYHHRDPSTKEYEVHPRIRQYSFKNIKSEIDKCDLLCAHCHRIFHHEENINYYKNNKEVVFERLEKLKEFGGKPLPTRRGLDCKYPKEEIEKLLKEGKTKKDISRLLNENYEAVSWMIRKYGLKPLKYNQKELSIEECIKKDYISRGYSFITLSQKYSLSEEEIIKTLESLNVPIRRKRKDFTEKDLEYIRELLIKKTPVKKIAQLVGCHLTTTYKIIKKHNLK